MKKRSPFNTTSPIHLLSTLFAYILSFVRCYRFSFIL